MRTFKGFNKDMTCREFQYEEGKEYEEKEAVACGSGFHACEYPLDCFSHYSPNESVYHEVEQTGELSKHSNDTKVASTKIKIGAEINIAGLVKAAIEYTTKKVNQEAKSDKICGASSATGIYGASSATGIYGASSATGHCGASSATGYKGRAEVGDSESVAVAWGYHGRARGVLGSYLVLADWDGNDDEYWTQNDWNLKGAKMVRVDGKKIKENVWYTMKNGKIVEA